MPSRSRHWVFDLGADFGHADMTGEARALVADSGVTTGSLSLGVVGSTGGITTIEYEPGALSDLRSALEKAAPRQGEYAHNARWGDGNGFSHIRSSLLKTGIVIPVADGQLQLGTWQQIVVLNFDNKKRRREVVGVVSGD
ncbi:MAG: secondary thiamine-phosphate synthase enzyme YjbQ [bacterium]